MTNDYLNSAKKMFAYYKMLGEKTFEQLKEKDFSWQYNAESNSIATIVKHLHGNMVSRWTDFLHSDGEKSSRNRDDEFENDLQTKEEITRLWNEGWQCLMDALESLSVEDLTREIYIRNQGHKVVDAINRQLAHYPYHVGQIVFIGKMICNDRWQSLSIPKGKSVQFNKDKFASPKREEHFTDEFLKGKKD
jgi:hypothetical protein